MSNSTFLPDYRFTRAAEISPEDWGLRPGNARIIQIVKPDFTLEFFDINVTKFIERRGIKFERTVLDRSRNLDVLSRGNCRVPEGLFPTMRADIPEPDWEIWDENYTFADEFFAWLQDELLNEENWWDHFGGPLN